MPETGPVLRWLHSLPTTLVPSAWARWRQRWTRSSHPWLIFAAFVIVWSLVVGTMAIVVSDALSQARQELAAKGRESESCRRFDAGERHRDPTTLRAFCQAYPAVMVCMSCQRVMANRPKE